MGNWEKGSSYKEDSGTAIIFSCSLLHEATAMISGERFALLSFFYGDEDALVRDAHFKYYVDRSPEDSRIAETAGSS